jgi:hypothetical protein
MVGLACLAGCRVRDTFRVTPRHETRTEVDLNGKHAIAERNEWLPLVQAMGNANDETLSIEIKKCLDISKQRVAVVCRRGFFGGLVVTPVR